MVRSLRQRSGIMISLAAVTVVMVIPLLWLVLESFKTNAEIDAYPLNIWPRTWTLSGFSAIFVQAGLGRAYLNSIGIAVVTVASVLLTSSLGGYAFAWLRFPGRKYGFYFVLSTTMLPFVTLLIPLYVVMSKVHLVDSYVGLWLPGAVSAFGIFLCRQFVYSIPLDLFSAAQVDGAGDGRIYWQIVLPLLKPALAVVGIFTFLATFNSYLWPLVMLSNPHLFTLPMVLANASSSFGISNYSAVIAGSLLTCIPTIVVFLVFQRQLVRGIALTGLNL